MFGITLHKMRYSKCTELISPRVQDSLFGEIELNKSYRDKFKQVFLEQQFLSQCHFHDAIFEKCDSLRELFSIFLIICIYPIC